MAVTVAPPATKKKSPTPLWTQADVQASIAANPYAGLGNYTGTFPSQDAFPATPNPVASPGAPGQIHVPGFTPDYASLIQGDPNVIAGQGDLNFYTGQVNDQRRAAIRSAVIQAGLVPPGTFGDLDEATLEAARQNKFSQAAELQRSRERSSADLGALLGARGMTRSGAPEGGSSRIQEGYERGTSQITNALLALISGQEMSAADRIANYRSQYNQLRESAAQRIANDPRYQPIGEGDAVLDQASGLYMTPDGRWFDASGKRVAAPGPASSTPAASVAPPPPAPLPVVTEFPNSRPVVNPLPGGTVRAV